MSTSRRDFLNLAAYTTLLLSSTSLSSTAFASAGSGNAPRPNIVVILIDDMGFSDIGCYGSEIPTPNIDALAAGGLRFTQFYNTPRCSPSRAALLTGTYPHQAGLGHLENFVVPGSRGLHGKLEDRVVTLAEVLRPAGYHTSVVGKWHLGITHGVGPWQRGFDRSLVSPVGEIYFPDQKTKNAQELYLDGRALPANSPEIGSGEWYSSNLFVDWAAKFAREAEAQKKPFLIYLPFVAVHFPLMSTPDEIARFRGHYTKNWDELRQDRLAKQKTLGIVGSEQKLPPRLPNTYDWEKLTPEERDRFDQIMAVYAADIAGMDRAVGTLVDALRQQGVLDNTLILFMADNGGNAESGPDGILEGGAPGGPDSKVFCGMNWATLENTPFQWFKHFTKEGGISSPFIAHWPKGIDPSLHGSLVHEPGHLIDVMPTLVEVAGAVYPRNFNGHDIVPAQGRSFAAAFSGRALHRESPLFWEHEGNRAIRDGNWKLVSRYHEAWELYDLTLDRSEQDNLAEKYPGLVLQLAERWTAWAAASYVDQWDDAFDTGHTRHRQNWGSYEVPRLPQASDQVQSD
jgi:arylsulfatase